MYQFKIHTYSEVVDVIASKFDIDTLGNLVLYSENKILCVFSRDNWYYIYNMTLFKVLHNE